MLTKSGDSWQTQWIKVYAVCLLVIFAVLDQNNGADAQQHRTLHFRAPPLQQRPQQLRSRPHPPLFRASPPGGTHPHVNAPTDTIERRHDQANQAGPDDGQRFLNGGHPFQGSNNEHQHIQQPTMEHFTRRQPTNGQRLQNRQQRGLLSASHTRQLLAALKPGAPRPSDPQLNAMIQQGLAMHGLPKNTPLSQLVPLVMKEIKSGRLSPAMIQSAMSSMQLPNKQPPPNTNNFDRSQQNHNRQQQNQNHHQRPTMHHPNQLQHSNQNHHIQQQNGNEFDRQMQERHQRELQQQQQEHERRQREERERNERQRFERDQQRQWHEQRQQEEQRHHDHQRLQHIQQQRPQQPFRNNEQPQQPFINNQQPQQPFRNNQQNQEFSSQRLPPPPMNNIDQQQQQQHPVPDRVPPPHPQQMPRPHPPSPEHVASEAVIRAQTSNRIPISLPEVSNAIAPLLINHHNLHPPSGHHEMMMMAHPHQQNNPQRPPHEHFMDDRPMPMPPQPFPNINFDLFKSLPSEPAMDDGPWTPLTRAPDRDWKPSDVRWYMAGDKAALSSAASVIASTIGPQLPSLESGEEGILRSKGNPGNPDEKENSEEDRGVTPTIPTSEFLDDQMDMLTAHELRDTQETRPHREENVREENVPSNSEESNVRMTSTSTPLPSTFDLDTISNIGTWQDKGASTPTSDISDPISVFAATAEPPSSTEIHDYHSTPLDSFESNIDRVKQAEPPMLDVTMSPPSSTVNPPTVPIDMLQSNTSWSLKTEVPNQPSSSTWYKYVSSTVHRQPADIAQLHSPDMDKEVHPWSPDHSAAGPLLYDHRHQKAEMTDGGFTTAIPVPVTKDMSGGSAASSIDMLSELFPGGGTVKLPGQHAGANPASSGIDSSSGFPAFSIEDIASFSRHPLLEEHLPMLRKHNLSHMSVDQLLEHWQSKFDMSYPDVGNVLSEKPPNQDGGDAGNKMAATTTEHQPTSFGRLTSSERSARSSPNVMITHTFPAYNIHAPVTNHQFLQNSVGGNKSEQNHKPQDATTLLTIGYQAALDLRPSDWSRRRHSQVGDGPRGQRQIADRPTTSQPEPAGLHPQISGKGFPTTPAPTVMDTTPRYGSYVKASTAGTISEPTASPDPSPPSNRPWNRRRNYNYGSAKKDLSQRRIQDVNDQEAAATMSDVIGSSPSAKTDVPIGGHGLHYRKQSKPKESLVGTVDAAFVLGQRPRPSRWGSSSEQEDSRFSRTLSTVGTTIKPMTIKSVSSDNITGSDHDQGQLVDAAARRGDNRDGSATADVLVTSTSEENARVADIRSTQLSGPKRKLARFLVRRRKVLKSATESPASSPEMAYSNPLSA